MSEIAIENRSGLITRLPTFAFVIACVVAGLLGSFVVCCISGVVFVGLLGALFHLGEEGQNWMVGLVLLATTIGFLPPIVLLRRARKGSRRTYIGPRPPSTHSEDKRIARTSESGVDPAIEEVELTIERQSSEPERIHGSPAISDVTSDDIKAISRRTSDNRNWIFPACVIVAVVILLAFFLTHNNDAPQLEFESGNSGYFAIKNVDTHPIKLLDVSINEREECKPRVGLFGLKPFESTELKVGDVILLLSPCSIVRTTLTTETGDWTHSFSR
jgi:hypothetical protein